MQNRINDQAAFILHRRDYQDSSLILDLFSEDYGRLSVLVKGAKKRRDAASFQICNRLSVG
ncbi:MAG: recombination protein O N-terminal domain-containing protein [Gammaproteobacteria bacterium]|nr:recombination protein O N-terminal domain-containing protein [Gammaproteobacteria bacterium]